MAPRTPDLPADFVELLAAFDRAEVHYLVIGGYAVGYHDRPRTTKVLDLLLDAAPDNLRRASEALADFGARRASAATLRPRRPTRSSGSAVHPYASIS